MSYVRLDIDVKEVGVEASTILSEIHGDCFANQWTAGTFETFLKNKVHSAFVAYTDDAPVGFVLVRTIAREAEILSIAMMPEHRGHGIASGLLYHVCEILSGQGVARIFLEVGRENRTALALYKKLGFESVGDRKAYYQGDSDGNRRDAIIMAKTF